MRTHKTANLGHPHRCGHFFFARLVYNPLCHIRQLHIARVREYTVIVLQMFYRPIIYLLEQEEIEIGFF